MSEKTICIVGAGVVGLCCAEALVRRGHAVTVLDRGEPGEGCSFGNGGLIVPSHFEPLANPGAVRLGLKMICRKGSPFGLSGRISFETLGWLTRFIRSANHAHVKASEPLLRNLHLASRELYGQMTFRLPFDFGYEKRGLTMVCQTMVGFESEKELAGTAVKMGLAAKIVNREELRSQGLEAKGGVYFEDDAQISPKAFMDGMRAHLESIGVVFRGSNSVTGFETRDCRIVSAHTPNGPCVADEFVLCAGSWSGELEKKLGLKLPMLAGRGCGLTIPGKLEQLSSPLIMTEARIAVTPYAAETRFVGLMNLANPASNAIWPAWRPCATRSARLFLNLQRSNWKRCRFG